MFIISSYLPKNCNGLHLRPDIMSLLDKSDMICVQETWYVYQDLDILHTVNSALVAAPLIVAAPQLLT